MTRSTPRRMMRSTPRRGRRIASARWLVAVLSLGGLTALSTPARGAERDDRSCRENAIGQRFCAPDATGTAVVDDLGHILCAPGRCVAHEDGWQCSSEPGGAASIDRRGVPECEGRCIEPESTYCEEVR